MSGNKHLTEQCETLDLEADPMEKMKDEPTIRHTRPASGRTTALGRRVERPGTGRQGGPSGQKDQLRHDRTHANK